MGEVFLVMEFSDMVTVTMDFVLAVLDNVN